MSLAASWILSLSLVEGLLTFVREGGLFSLVVSVSCGDTGSLLSSGSISDAPSLSGYSSMLFGFVLRSRLFLIHRHTQMTIAMVSNRHSVGKVAQNNILYMLSEIPESVNVTVDLYAVISCLIVVKIITQQSIYGVIVYFLPSHESLSYFHMNSFGY